MIELHFLASFLLLVLSLFMLLVKNKSKTTSNTFPNSYPLIGSTLAISANKHRRIQWISDLLNNSPTGTITLDLPLSTRRVYTVNPENVEHILKSKFHLYSKGENFRTAHMDLLGSSIFNSDGNNWKFQRKISSHEFNAKSLRRFVEIVVESEVTQRLIPILSNSKSSIIDFQDLLQRFTFDNISKIAFGYHPEYLSPSLPQEQFAIAFDNAVRIGSGRSNSIHPLLWKAKRFLNYGSEKHYKQAISQVRGFAMRIVAEKKQQSKPVETEDLLSRFLDSRNMDEELVIDMVVGFILAGKDSTSAALTWFFWLLSYNSRVEEEILKEIGEKPDTLAYDEVKDMVYTHAALCESMRLYPPVPVDTREAEGDDVLPDGTVMKKGMRITYHPYAMGRMEKLWGADWEKFMPERRLVRDEHGKWSFVGRDPYSYPVFNAGPRVCLGKDMAFLQMKKIVAGILPRFRVVPMLCKVLEPVYIANITAKMKGGFPVKVEKRGQP